MLAERHGGAVWLVGGWVRDQLLARETHDLDFVVPHGAVATARTIANALDGSFVLLDEERDTARVVFGPPQQPTYLDLAGLRAPNIEADLLDRDFTINAMAVPASRWQDFEGVLIDPSGGRRDLELGLVRAVSREAFRADPLRMVRGVRLIALLGFDLERRTADWIRDDAGLLVTVSRERVRDELLQILGLPEARRSLWLLEGLGLLERILPELAALRTVPARGAGDSSTLAHSFAVVDTVESICGWLQGEPPEEPDGVGWMLASALNPYRTRLADHLAEVLPGGHTAGLMLAVAALLHDLGQAAPAHVQVPQEGRVLGHEVLGASLVATAMRRLCFSGAEIQRVRQTVASHPRPRQLAAESGGQPSSRKVYRFFRDAGSSGPDTILLSLADHQAVEGYAPSNEDWRRHLALTRALLEAYYERRRDVVEPPAIVDGHDLMSSLDLPPGPEIGGLLESIREAQAAGEVRSRDEAVELARRLLEKGHPTR